jgi:hypothetical protein
LEEDAHPLFNNPRIARKLTLDARRHFVDELVKEGGAAWLGQGRLLAVRFPTFAYEVSHRHLPGGITLRGVT